MIFIRIPWANTNFWSFNGDWFHEDVVEWFAHYNLLVVGSEPTPGCVEKLDYRTNRFHDDPGIAFHPDDANLAMLAKLKWGGE